jgi:hypothetical protein
MDAGRNPADCFPDVLIAKSKNVRLKKIINLAHNVPSMYAQHFRKYTILILQAKYGWIL